MSRTERLSQPKQFGKYELVARLTKGAMGVVYRAKSHGVEGFEKVLLVKVIHPGLAANPNFINTLIDETQKITSLAHANIAQVYDLGREETTGQFYVAGEYVAGFDLARTLQLRRIINEPQPLELSVFIGSEVAKALDYAHRRKDFNFNSLNIVHRHLAPQNIMLSFEGEVKVTDFGISAARAYGAAGPEDALDVMYAAPELIAGAPSSQQTDLFSLGLVLYEMLSGTHPYASPRVADIQRKAAAAEIAPLAEVTDLPRQLTAIVDSLLVPDPAGRRSDAASVYEDLVGYIFGNNLRADSRALGITMQELRRHDQRLHPEDSTREVGVEEISLSDLHVMDERSNPAIDTPVLPDRTHASLPSHKLGDLFGNERPALPGTLEEYYTSARMGRGKAVLVEGSLGAGRQYLPDRLVDALGWRGNTRAFALQTTEDDTYVPFRVLTDVILETLQCPNNPTEALVALREQGVDPEMIAAFASVVGAPSVSLGKARKRLRLSELALHVLREATQSGPLVISIDRVERLDQLSLDAIRDIIGAIGDMALMLVMGTAATDAMRSAFDIGRPESLEVVRVVGKEPPALASISPMSDTEQVILLLVSLAGQPVSASELGRLTGIAQHHVGEALRQLADAGALRVPALGVVTLAGDDGAQWARAHFDRATIELWAGALARHYKSLSRQSSLPTRWGPLLLRLYAQAGDRRRTLTEARAYATWLEHDGWIHAALDFFNVVATMIAENQLGSPQARIDFLLMRADLALELAKFDVCRSALQPVNVLSEAARNDHGATRAQLLLGQLALQQDDLVEAHKHLRRAVNAAAAVNDADLFASAMLAFARWHDRYGDAPAAQRCLERAMNLYHQGGTYRIDLNTRALLLNRAVRMLSRRGLTTLAGTLLDDLLGLAKNTKLPMVLCRADWAQAAVFIAAGQYPAARELLLQAEVRAMEHGLVALRLELLRERAVASLSDEDYVDVVALCDELEVVARAHDDIYSQQRAEDLRATASCLLNTDVAASIAHLEASLRRAHERAVPKDIYRCHLNLDRALHAAGNAEAATQHRLAAEQIAYDHRATLQSSPSSLRALSQ